MSGTLPPGALSLQRSMEELRPRFEAAGQGHVFRFWERLKEAERAGFLAQLRALDLGLLSRLVAGLSGAMPEAGPARLEPAPVIRLPAGEAEVRAVREARELGEEALRRGRVGAFLVAGGQGTRLGFDGPKGAFEIGPLTKRSLFQLHAEKIRALRRRHGAALPWVIMTSTANDRATRAFFAARDFFGLGSESVRFIVQENMAAVDREGRLLLAEPGSLALNPNGHGGSIKALFESGTLRWLKEQGIDTLFYFQVDNVLTRLCDPVFLGHHLGQRAEMSSKVLRKRDWKEPVGVIGYLDGRLGVIEYSDLPERLAREVDAEGQLRFWAGSIAIHLLDLSFVERLNQAGFQLPFHRAFKQVPGVDSEGRPLALAPGEKNGIKFETFVFDALGAARTAVTLETAREDDFGPVKNATGEDSVETARAYLVAQYARWLEGAGVAVPRDGQGLPACGLEISPLTSLEGEGLTGLRIEVPPGGALVL